MYYPSDGTGNLKLILFLNKASLCFFFQNCLNRYLFDDFSKFTKPVGVLNLEKSSKKTFGKKEKKALFNPYSTYVFLLLNGTSKKPQILVFGYPVLRYYITPSSVGPFWRPLASVDVLWYQS